MTQTPPKGRLISQFENRPTTSHGEAWSDLWNSGQSDLWDRGIPSPALIDLVEAYNETLFYPFQAAATSIRSYQREGGEEVGVGVGVGRRKKVLVPGCGRGYDVIALALHGFDAYGLEISGTAVSEAREFAEQELASPQACNFGTAYSANPSVIQLGKGKAQFVEGDFFDETWPDELGVEQFDVVYDYTFLCALHPSQRGRWAERMAELLKPRGLLVCLEFPMYKDPGLPGPPWGVNGVHWEILAGGDEGVGKFTRRVYMKPKRTYEVGKGSDMISVYEKK